MKKIVVSLFLIFLLTNSMFAQKEGNIWCFGVHAGLDFNSGSPVCFAGPAINQWEGCSSISDTSGHLLFYTDGAQVWNKNHAQMPNGFGMLSNSSSTQAGLIVKQPGNTNIYYVFSTDGFLGPNGFNYSIVDMTLQNGLGDVTTKNVRILSYCDERACAVTQSNGKDVWVITTTGNTDTIKSFSLTSGGLNLSPVISALGIHHGNSYIGCLKPSGSGKKLAVAYFDGGFDLYDFDRSTGMISNPIVIKSNTYSTAYGVEFSPNETRMYGVNDAGTGIYQFDLTAGSPTAIINSGMAVGNSSDYSLGTLQLGPDGKIYLARHATEYLGVINYPDSLGVKCNFVDSGLHLLYGELSYLGLPNIYIPVRPKVVLPIALFSVSDTAICSGSAINFNNLSSKAVSYQWNFPGAVPDTSSLANPVNIQYPQAGHYDVQLIAINGDGADTMLLHNYINVLTIAAANNLSANPDSICTGSTSQLSVDVTGDVIQWQFSPDLISFTNIPGSHIGNYTTSPLYQATSYRVITHNALCADTSSPVTVVIKSIAPPTLSTNDSLICSSDSTRINTSGSYTSYNWNNGAKTNYTYARNAGGYWVTVTDINGCTAVSTHQNISVYPVASVSLVVQGDTLASLNAVSYQWFLNDTPISGATDPVYIARQSGDYAVEITDTNGCKALSNNTPVFVSGISKIAGDNGLIIYPDPFINEIAVKWMDASLRIESIKLYDVLGRMVLNKKYENILTGLVKLDVSTLQQGVYYLKINTDQTEYVRPLIKQR